MNNRNEKNIKMLTLKQNYLNINKQLFENYAIIRKNCNNSEKNTIIMPYSFCNYKNIIELYLLKNFYLNCLFYNSKQKMNNIWGFIVLVYLIAEKVSSAYYLPSFVQQSNITVSQASNVSDPCRFFQITNSTLYRMGKKNLIQSWDLNSMAYNSQSLYQTANFAEKVSNIGITQTSNQMTVTLISSANTKHIDILNPSTLLKNASYVNSTTFTYAVIKVQTTASQYLVLCYSNYSLNVLNIYNKSMSLQYTINLNFTGLMNSTLSKDGSAIAVWNYQGYVRYIQKIASVWTFTAIYTPYSNIQAMNSITLSQNGSLALLQYDYLSMLTIVNFRSITVLSTRNFTSNVVNQAIFLDKDCHLLAVMVNYTTLRIYDSFTLTLRSGVSFSTLSNYSTIDYSTGKLYICTSQNIEIYQINCPTLTYRSPTTNECILCVLGNNCTGCDQATGFCNICSTNFTLNISSYICQVVVANETNNTTNISNITASNYTVNFTNSTTNSSVLNATVNSTVNQTGNQTNSTTDYTIVINYTSDTNTKRTISNFEESTVNFTLKGLDAISPTIATIFMIVQMSPFALLFLSFTNYWSICCIYSIMNLNIPQYIPEIHQQIFNAIQSSIFVTIGLNPSPPVLDNENVSQNFAVNYGISIDFPTSNFQNLMMILFVLSIMIITSIIRCLLFKKSSVFYKYLEFNIIQSILGQFISFVPFCIIPYMFLANKIGCHNFSEKINFVLQIILLILCFSAPGIFIWSRNQKTLQKNMEKSKKFQSFKQNPLKSKKILVFVQEQDNKIQTQNLKQLQMFIVNISVSFLIILPVYLPFFIINMIIFSYGVKHAWKSKQYRVNSIITSCYLPIYHFCYIIFYFFGQNIIISHYTGLVCITVLFLGGIHQLANILIITLIKLLIWIFKSICKSSKVQNSNQCCEKKQKDAEVVQNQDKNKQTFQKRFKIKSSFNKVANVNSNSYGNDTENQAQIKELKLGQIQPKHNSNQNTQIKQPQIRQKLKAIKFKAPIVYTYREKNSIKKTDLLKIKFTKKESLLQNRQFDQSQNQFDRSRIKVRSKANIQSSFPTKQILQNNDNLYKFHNGVHLQKDDIDINQILKQDYKFKKNNNQKKPTKVYNLMKNKKNVQKFDQQINY